VKQRNIDRKMDRDILLHCLRNPFCFKRSGIQSKFSYFFETKHRRTIDIRSCPRRDLMKMLLAQLCPCSILFPLNDGTCSNICLMNSTKTFLFKPRTCLIVFLHLIINNNNN
jgi:hypothetical protein